MQGAYRYHRGPLCISERAWCWVREQTLPHWCKLGSRFFFLIQESKMKIERKGFSWSWGPGRDARNVRISPVKTRDRTALRCPFSDPFSASVLHSLSCLYCFCLSLFSLCLSTACISLVLGGVNMVSTAIYSYFLYSILYCLKCSNIAMNFLSAGLGFLPLWSPRLLSQTSLTYFVFRVFLECTSKNSRVRAEDSLFLMIFSNKHSA